MKYPYLFCSNIGVNCPDKLPDGRCKRTRKLDSVERCDDSIVVEDKNMGFLIKYLYHIRSDAPRVISTTAQPMETYPNDLYCTQIEQHCPHQTPGGKCKLHENIRMFISSKNLLNSEALPNISEICFQNQVLMENMKSIVFPVLYRT